MNQQQLSFSTRVRDFLETLLALKMTEAERMQYADPYNIFYRDLSNRKPMRVSVILATLFHILLFLIIFPSLGRQVLLPTQQVLLLRQLAQPAALAGGGARPETAPPKPKPTVPDPEPKLVPIPDPTPNAPEPIRRKEIEEVPRVLEEIAPELNIGDLTAPPGPPARGGQGQGRVAGSAPAAAARASKPRRSRARFCWCSARKYSRPPWSGACQAGSLGRAISSALPSVPRIPSCARP